MTRRTAKVTRGIRDADGHCKACGWPVDQHSRPQLNGCRQRWRKLLADDPGYRAPRRVHYDDLRRRA